MKMIDVGGKKKTERVALATARVRMLPATLERILAGKVEKGDVLAAAKLAAVMGAKRTPDLVPLCHPISLSSVTVELLPDSDGSALDVRVEVKTMDRTGVEMEALTAACAASLTVYDMLKSVDRGMEISQVRLEHKSGGRSGSWNREAPGPAPAGKKSRR